jgi:holo-[acyl-carrier protein] synthase
MFMIGLGIDLIDMEHFERLYGNDDEEVLARCFTQGELADAGKGKDRHQRRAARLAAKEALYKALGGAKGVAHTDIETIRTSSGAPTLRLHGAAKALAEERGAEVFFLSLTHTTSSAAAVVVAMAGPR